MKSSFVEAKDILRFVAPIKIFLVDHYILRLEMEVMSKWPPYYECFGHIQA